MNSPTTPISSPKFKNLKSKVKCSPIEIKEKMRKNYKDKVQNCRELLLNRFRGTVIQTDLRSTLNEIYKSMFTFSHEETTDDEEIQLINEIKNELIEEELEWLVEEYEKSQRDHFTDWVEDDSCICPVCQKNNCQVQNNFFSCSKCNFSLKTLMPLKEIKHNIFDIIEKHSATCENECQFNVVSELSESHLYLICDNCMEMQMVI
ncbi:uncharacterized protein LOC106131828 [Amyelois transitella]|uniref:uncharacterized protein LOC106131828 n=1 Tax=Amyelois transitella TaxID=680683 RepID=UPI00067CCB7F|nr:uncharacterized protein LOC106131828 [Amyelois transitella]